MRKFKKSLADRSESKYKLCKATRNYRSQCGWSGVYTGKSMRAERQRGGIVEGAAGPLKGRVFHFVGMVWVEKVEDILAWIGVVLTQTVEIYFLLMFYIHRHRLSVAPFILGPMLSSHAPQQTGTAREVEFLLLRSGPNHSIHTALPYKSPHQASP